MSFPRGCTPRRTLPGDAGTTPECHQRGRDPLVARGLPAQGTKRGVLASKFGVQGDGGCAVADELLVDVGVLRSLRGELLGLGPPPRGPRGGRPVSRQGPSRRALVAIGLAATVLTTTACSTTLGASMTRPTLDANFTGNAGLASKAGPALARYAHTRPSTRTA